MGTGAQQAGSQAEEPEVLDRETEPAPGSSQPGAPTGGSQTPRTEESSAHEPEPARVHQVPDTAFKQIREQARAQGRRQAMEDFEAKVKQHGFEGMDDFLTALAALKRGGGSTPAAPGAPTPAADSTKAPAATAGASAEERAQMLRQRNAGHRDRTQTLRRLDEADRIRREKEAEIQRLQAERAQLRMRHEIELAAVRAGAKDADMIVAKVASHVANLDDAGVAAFDLGEYLKAVRKDWPALFGETRIPADTGTGTEAPPAPGSGDAVRGAADTSVNLRQGSRTEYEARLAELGVALPTLGMPDVAR